MSKAPAAPDWEEALDEFWASHMEDLRVSLPRHRVVMTVRVTDPVGKTPSKAGRSIVEWYELAFEGAIRFVFDDHYGRPWRVVELEEIGKRPAAKGKTEYGFDLTGIEDALSITCDEVRVTFLQSEEWHENWVR